jgi:hypothetical protein
MVGRLGMCITIQPLEGRVDGSSMLELDVGITVNETPMLNRTPAGTSRTATQAVIQLCRVFSDRAAKSTILNSWTLGDDSGTLLTYRLKGRVTARLSFT